MIGHSLGFTDWLREICTGGVIPFIIRCMPEKCTVFVMGIIWLPGVPVLEADWFVSIIPHPVPFYHLVREAHPVIGVCRKHRHNYRCYVNDGWEPSGYLPKNKSMI